MELIKTIDFLDMRYHSTSNFDDQNRILSLILKEIERIRKEEDEQEKTRVSLMMFGIYI